MSGTDWEGKYIIVEDLLAKQLPGLLPVSAVCDSLAEARRSLAISGPPMLCGRFEFVFEEVARTVVFRGAGANATPRSAKIYRTSRDRP